MAQTFEQYKAFVAKRLGALSDIFARAAVGDFSKDVFIPDEEDEFSELYAGVQVMLEVIREELANLQKTNEELEVRVKERTASLTRSEERLRTIFESAPIGIYTINKQGVIDSFNPKMVELAGAKNAQEVIGLNALTLPNYKEAGLDVLFKKGLKGVPFEIEAAYRSHTAGKYTFRHYHGVPIFGPDGKTVEQLLLTVEDVSDRKEAEDALQARTKELERINKFMIGREVKMAELKNRLTALENQLPAARAKLSTRKPNGR